MFRCDSEHNRGREHASCFERLHGLFEIQERNAVDGWHFRSDGTLIGRNVVEEVSLLVFDYFATKPCNAKVRKIPVRVIQSQSDNTFAEQRPENLKKQFGVTGG